MAHSTSLLLCGLAITIGAGCQGASDRTTAARGTVADQDAPRLSLAPPSDSLPHQFGKIASTRELSDGRVLVSDETAVQLLIVDFTDGSVSVVGREGQGPGEYRAVGGMWPVRGDTTLHKEPYASRLIVLAGSDVMGTFASGDSIVQRLGATPILGTDTTGHVVIAAWHRDAQGQIIPADSLHLVRVNWKTGVTDTVTRIQSEQGWSGSSGVKGGGGPAAAGSPSGGGGSPKFAVSLSAPDQVAVLPSGWIAVARARPYRVDWCSPDRACTTGSILLPANPRLTDDHKRVYLQRAARTFAWPLTEDIAATSGWPEVLPPFITPPGRGDASAVLPAPVDRVLVRRTENAGSVDIRYDVVDRMAGMVGWFELPPTERVVGFGTQHVYVSRLTEDGSEQLRKHPWTF